MSSEHSNPPRDSQSVVLFGLTLIGLAAGVVYLAAASSGPHARSFVEVRMMDEPVLGDGARAEAAASFAPAAEIFATHCATCHGTTGKGDGPASYLLFPKPRDFTAGVYRFKSTYDQAPPTKADLERNIRNGIARTAMPAFNGILSDAEIASLIDYVLSLNTKPWANEAAEPVTIPPRPQFNAGLIEQGQRIFVAMGCVPCHGETGRGDGPSAQGLLDADDYPLPPADFTTGVFKAGRTPEDLYRTILVGVPGTPMPSFQAAMNANIQVEGVSRDTDMVWAMVAYLQSLIEPREREGVVAGATISAGASRNAKMLADPFDSSWNAVEPVAVALQPLWQRRHSTRSAEVRAVRFGERIAFCVEWADETVNGSETLGSATDSVGLMFGLTAEIPTLTMGLAQPDAPSVVNLWQWKASRQIDADAGERQDIDVLSEDQPVDMYPFKKGSLVAGPLTEHDPTFVSAWGVGNPQSDPNLMKRPVLCMNAAGFGSTTIAPSDDQNVDGVGRWRDGMWRVVFVRDLHAHHEGDVDFATMQRVPVAFAVWDGAAMDRNGTKLISGWHWLEIGR